MYEPILSAIKQEIQTLMTVHSVDFVMVRKLADIATEIQASSVTSVEEIGSSSIRPVAVRAQAYGPTGTERLMSEFLPQIMPLLQAKFASDSLSSLSSLLQSYTQVSNPDTPGYDQELASAVKGEIERHLKEEKHEDIHTDVPG